MKKYLYLLFVPLFFFSCKKGDFNHIDEEKAEIQRRLDEGETPFEIVNSGVDKELLYGLFYQGGHLFYVDEIDEYGMVAHIQSNLFYWGCAGTLIPDASGTSFGTGPNQTSSIVQNCADPLTAAFYCDQLNVNGYEDWWLPNRMEMALMANNIRYVLPNYFPGTYDNILFWTSSQYDEYEAYSVSVSGYNPSTPLKEKQSENAVIPVRRFTGPGFQYSVQMRLDSGETAIDVYNSGIPYDSLMGKEYKGGHIFYLDTSLGNGLVAQPRNFQYKKFWGCNGSSIVGADGTAMGDGITNSQNIIDQCTNTSFAALHCSELTIGGYNDWYLPSVDELSLVYTVLKAPDLVNYYEDDYWTSTQVSSNQANYINFDFQGSVNQKSKSNDEYVLAIRNFNQ